ncbi:MAG: response regulator, partial [Alphaproteobacteria bacterium]
MLTITRHAEEKLQAALGQIRGESLAWRAVYFYFGTGTLSADDLAQQPDRVVPLMRTVITDDSAKLFFLTDGDMVLLVAGTRKEQLDAACALLHRLYPDSNGQRNAAMLLDLSAEFNKLASMVDTKVNTLRARTDAEKAAAEAARAAIRLDPAVAKESLARRASRKGLTILLVEDDPFTQQLVGNVLKDFTILRATDGLDAVETYMLNAPDLVFLDIGLPTMSGHEVLTNM